MTGRHVPFEELLSGADFAHLRECPECAARAERARRLLAAGRRAAAAPRPSRRAMRRAMEIFRKENRTPRTFALKLALDSLLQPAPALRDAGTPARFLRYMGDVTIDIQVTPAKKGVDLRGQLLPPGYATEVVLVAGSKRRSAAVGEDGTFRIKDAPRTKVDLEIGSARITGLEL